MRKLVLLSLVLMATFVVAPSIFADGCTASKTCSNGSTVSCGGSSSCSVGSSSVTCDGVTQSCSSSVCYDGKPCLDNRQCGVGNTCFNGSCICQ